MNVKTLSISALFAVLTLGAVSAQAANVQEQTYAYGEHLDVHKVLSLTEDAQPTCGVVNARMKYLDSAGVNHALDYKKYSDNCLQDN
ncbi:MAG: DUF2790 domain-containing protein [Pseudomonas sp.]|uniref:DUF2790 domain-containing protein n=1 Tax=Pseudomonas abieticivorans TaxID=2931382 RepID=UPI0020BD8364|nr:DUF2790 domain-containing protein [Pseudomonas sp. PIA16]MDE1169505.1 DUF2790 domain-containing protein [Pseudomonas sp.]